MELLNLFFVLLATTAIFAAPFTKDDNQFALSNNDRESTSLRGVSRFLAEQNLIANLTCNKFPRICRLKSSPGPDCCKKKCVNVMKDRLNCGMCGYKCKYNEICCKGKCVNASFDRKHCGGCNKKCKKGEFCAYGLCNYA